MASTTIVKEYINQPHCTLPDMNMRLQMYLDRRPFLSAQKLYES